MKKLIILLWFLVLLFAWPCWGATYYISQSGTGNGTAVGTPDSIADFNTGGAPFDDLGDDTVYLLGTITTTVTVPDGGTDGHIATIRGDYAGQECTLDAADTNDYGLDFNSKDYVTVQNLNVEEANVSNILMSGDHCIVSGVKSSASNGNNIGISGTANTVKFCYLDAGGDGIADSGGTNIVQATVFDTQTDDGIITTAAGSKYYNLTIYTSGGDGIELEANAEVKNTVFEAVVGSDINENGGSATEATNYASATGNPLFTDAANDDFSLATGSPCIDAGTGLGAAYDDALHLVSEWSDFIVTIDQDAYGAAWEIGAYVFRSSRKGARHWWWFW